ncbi:hypothetical protein [Bacillus cereus]|uniref:HNH nuclease domain-containing protein n=1 Tax=Bacillus cereus TaxID=1396 RepID=A0A9X7LUM9_BACCE|nr:hypothetical protein [Bacillus cereus]QDZ73470.1 hypothetical protein D0437_10285 [Bacillus cereus]
MIYIQRKLQPPELDLTNPKSIGYKELEDAKKTTFTKDSKFEFKAYKNANVKRILHEMFNGKCGYCEGRIDVTSYEDIEHFRPKKAIKIEGKPELVYPGYYWLAMDWDNLLVSCSRCNRSYKQNLFPLADESKRAKEPKEIALEEPLLLNPCVDNPSEHLVFKDTGVVTFKKGSIKGEKSIDIYGLYRQGLTDERAMLAKDIKFKMVQICDEVMDLKELASLKGNPNFGKLFERRVQSIIMLYDNLIEHINDPKRPYREMVKQLTAEFLSKHQAEISNLRAVYNRKTGCEPMRLPS